jgi:transaldolase
MTPIQALHALGQSLWYDNIQRRFLEDGSLAAMIQRGDIRGVTSNPTIFHNAIARSPDYDPVLKALQSSELTAEQVFIELAIQDIRSAADLFTPLYDETQAGDGFVSLEVSPYLAHNTAATLAEAIRLWELVNRPNLMVKIPATPAGIPAITQAIAAGVNVNVTLIFSLERYAEVMHAYMLGLETRVAAGLPIQSINSVASFFVSRIDTKIDAQLQEISQRGVSASRKASALLGKAAIANARLAYSLFKETFSQERFQRLAQQGGRYQRPLWASTSTKNPNYRDVIYIEELIGPRTVNTAPPQTLEAFREHGITRLSVEEDLEGARQCIRQLANLGISMAQVTQQLEDEGVQAFSNAYTQLLTTLEDKRNITYA